jgi:hypothetical protein
METIISNTIKWPAIQAGEGSLTALEKSILGNFILLSDAQVILEFGSFKGVTTKFLVEFCQINQMHAKIFAFDIPEVTNKLSKIPELEKAISSGMLTFVGGYLPHSLIQWKSNNSSVKVDLVLDDALHSYKSVWEELNLVWPILNDGGYVLCHDYSHKYEGVRLAVNRFAKRMGANIHPLVSKNTFSNESNSKIIHKSVLVSLSKKSSFLESSFSEALFVRKFYLKQFWARTHLWKFIRPYIKKIKEN